SPASTDPHPQKDLDIHPDERFHHYTAYGKRSPISIHPDPVYQSRNRFPLHLPSCECRYLSHGPESANLSRESPSAFYFLRTRSLSHHRDRMPVGQFPPPIFGWHTTRG